MHERIPFTLGYEALKLLGKGMYSNLWAALSELIANGIDAHAENVFVYIDMSEKEHSIIEILDDGDGMSIEDIKNKYVVIGNNKRDGAIDAKDLMGRKGVGKLAALFLTQKFEFLTATITGEQTTWRFDFTDRTTTKPTLENVPQGEYVLQTLFNRKGKGTLLKLFDVNLTNMAEEAVNALSLIMANYFLYQNLPKVKVHFFTKFEKNEVVDFDKPKEMKKQVAFGNMLAIYGDEEFIIKLGSKKYKYPLEYGKFFDSDYLEKERKNMSLNEIESTKGIYSVVINGRKVEIPYELKGWIGIHASINQVEAEKNDELFKKNRFYNPNKLRLYIRNKLAVEDFIGYIKNTQQGINYIEGEISFDLLDSDLLDDITTSNRQDVDIHDPRVAKLIEIVKKIVNKLISERNDLTSDAAKENKRRKDLIESEAKRNAKKAIKKDLTSLGIQEDKVDEVVATINNKFKGSENLKAKEIYKIFISHSKRDRRFSDFIYYLLIAKGALPEDIFYTTRYVGAKEDLTKAIKENIAENNVMVLFLDSVNFKRSEYCLFEGGAYWATRAVEDCIHLHFDASWIPEYINSRTQYHVPLNEGRSLNFNAFNLTSKKYQEVTDVLNILIDHLNSSVRHISSKIKKFDKVDFPSELQLQQTGKKVTDFMDTDFVEHWDYYVVQGNTDKTDGGENRTKENYLDEYNKLVEKMS